MRRVAASTDESFGMRHRNQQHVAGPAMHVHDATQRSSRWTTTAGSAPAAILQNWHCGILRVPCALRVRADVGAHGPISPVVAAALASGSTRSV